MEKICDQCGNPFRPHGMQRFCDKICAWENSQNESSDDGSLIIPMSLYNLMRSHHDSTEQRDELWCRFSKLKNRDAKRRVRFYPGEGDYEVAARYFFRWADPFVDSDRWHRTAQNTRRAFWKIVDQIEERMDMHFTPGGAF
jgi:hypothetical protein